MSENLRVLRLYLAVLGIFAVGRWLMGVKGVPYERGHHVFSIVIMTTLACFFYVAFTRRWRGYKVLRAMVLAVTMGFASQLVILLATVLSYALGMNTYFNHPTALNANHALPLGEALAGRLMGLLANSLMSGIVGAFGWALGGLLPEGPS